MKQELVSVVIPTYKSRGGLRKSVDSVLAQTYRNLEVLVVDDNNPDTSERAATEKEMAIYDNDSRVVYIKHEKNKNGAAARNTAIRASHGEYIAFLDDDDEWLPEKIEKQLAFLNEHKEFDACYTFTVSHNKVPKAIPYEGDVMIPLLMGRSRMYTSTLLMSRESVLAINGFDESFRRHQDYEFLIRFFIKGFKIGCLREVLVRYTPLGGNSLRGKDLLELKHRFLYLFDVVLDDIDKKQHGMKNKIYAANYAAVFYADLSHKKLKDATSVFVKYFFVSPLTFISQLCFLVECKLSKKTI